MSAFGTKRTYSCRRMSAFGAKAVSALVRAITDTQDYLANMQMGLSVASNWEERTRPAFCGKATKQRRGAADCGEYRQAAGAVGKALKLWRNVPTAYPFDSNNVVAITRVLFQSRHAWFCPHQYRCWIDGCGGALGAKDRGQYLQAAGAVAEGVVVSVLYSVPAARTGTDWVDSSRQSPRTVAKHSSKLANPQFLEPPSPVL